MMSCMRMDAASSCNAVSSKSFLGCFGLVSIRSSGIRSIPVIFSAMAGRRLPAAVFKSESIFCSRERIPFPSASLLFLFGVVIIIHSFSRRLFQDSFFLTHAGHIVFLQYFLRQVQVIHGTLTVGVI